MVSNNVGAVHYLAGRVKTGLGALQIEIIYSGGTIRLDPNLAAMAAHLKDLKLKDPVGPSTLSGQPGYVYRSSETQFIFTKEELYRFLGHALHPDEFFNLFNQFGDFYEIHEDFYDPMNGEALQPV